MNLSDYKQKKKFQLLMTQGNELVTLLQNMRAQLIPYKHFSAARSMMNNLDENEVFLRLTLKKLKEENNEPG